MGKIKSYFNKINKFHIMLAVIIIVELCYTTYVFAFEKQAVHSDELWSYGLANSYYQPHIFIKDGVFIDDMTMDDVTNFNEWTTGETYKDYLTVQKGERFAYGSVYHNQTLDHHPPLYYMLLHTVCSFFPDSFSYYYSYFLNCIFLVITQVFLFKLVRSISGSEWAAILGCVLYGAGTGALSTFIFLRQYSLLTALGVMYTYYNAELYRSEEYDLKKYLPQIAILSFLMFMTHYTSIAYVGIFTACFCIYLLCRKKLKKTFIYGGTVLAALVLYFVCYPASLMQIGGYSADRPYLSFWSQIRRLSSYLTDYNLGFHISIYKTNRFAIIVAVAVILLAVLVPLCFLFRKEPWFVKIKGKTKAYLKYVGSELKRMNFVWIFTFAGIVAMIAVVSKISDITRMGNFAMRYIFITFPLGCALACVLIYKFVGLIPKLGRFSALVTALAVVATVVKVNVVSPSPFVIQHSDQYQAAEEVLNGKNCVVIIDESINVWFITCFTKYIMTADNVFITSAEDIEDELEEINGLGEKIDYVLVDGYSFTLSNDELSALGLQSGSDNGVELLEGINEMESEALEKSGYSPKAEECTDAVKKINGGCSCKPLYWMDIQGSKYYMLELD